MPFNGKKTTQMASAHQLCAKDLAGEYGRQAASRLTQEKQNTAKRSAKGRVSQHKRRHFAMRNAAFCHTSANFLAVSLLAAPSAPDACHGICRGQAPQADAIQSFYLTVILRVNVPSAVTTRTTATPLSTPYSLHDVLPPPTLSRLSREPPTE